MIATRMGSVPEIITNGITGFIIDTVNDAVIATKRVGDLDRCLVRQSFEDRFTTEREAAEYVKVYESLISATP